MAEQLSERETAVLKIIEKCSGERAHPATGPDLARILNADTLAVRNVSAAGAHQTAASLVRKGLARRAGTSKLQWYTITQKGIDALKGGDPS